jgi:Xaa-Pro dipeptidase
MPQPTNYSQRIASLQTVMAKLGFHALVLEPGPAMLYLTGVRWGKSERTFAMVMPAKGAPVWVLPGFEEARARELIRVGDDIRVWQEDESPYQRIVEGLRDRGVPVTSGPGRIAVDPAARFFVFDGIRKLAPKLQFTDATDLLKQSGVAQ